MSLNLTQTAIKVKDGNNWTPVLAIKGDKGDPGESGGGVVTFTQDWSTDIISCDKTFAEIEAMSDKGPVVGLFAGNIFYLIEARSSYAIFIFHGDYGEGEEYLYYLYGATWNNPTWLYTEKERMSISDIQDASGTSLVNSTTGIATISSGGGGGGGVVNFTKNYSTNVISCDKTFAEIDTMSESGAVIGLFEGNIYHLLYAGSTSATFTYHGDFGDGEDVFYILDGASYKNPQWTHTETYRTTVNDIQDTNGNSLINSSGIAVIPSGGGGGGDVEWATYGTTPYSTIKGWHTAGKIVCCLYQARVYQLVYTQDSVNLAWFSNVDVTGSSTQPYLRYLRCQSSSWQDGSAVLEYQGNRLPSTSTWSDSDYKYPTTKAVANYVAAQLAAHGIS